MRTIVSMMFFSVVSALPVWGDEKPEHSVDLMLDLGQLTYGDESLLIEMLPQIDPKTSCYIGHLIFSYSKVERSEREQTRVDLEDLPPVSKVLKLALPDKALKSLVKQQLRDDHRFELEQLGLVSQKQTGYRWNVVWALYPRYGGFSGVPYRYRVLVTDRGKRILPELYLYDLYYSHRVYLSSLRKSNPTKEYLCSLIKLNGEPKKEQNKLSQQQIEERGRAAFQKLLKKVKVTPGEEPIQFEFVSCRAIEFPLRVDADGKIQSVKLWGVNFQEISRPGETKTEDIFTVWVSESGTVSELKMIPIQ